MKEKLKSYLPILGIIIAIAIFYFLQRYIVNRDLNDALNNLPIYYEEYASEYLIEVINEVNSGTRSISNNELKAIVKEIHSFNEDTFKMEPFENVTRISILTNERSGRYLEKGDGYVECEISVIRNGVEEIKDSEAKVKIRGNSTADAPKKPYNIKFSEKVDLLGTGKTKKWNLLAECYDPSLMRNYLFQNLAKNIGLEYTSVCEYVDVMFDGIYMGTYLLIEPTDAGKTGVDVDIDNGDFLIEYEFERVEDETTYITVGEEKLRFAINEPEEPNNEQLAYIENTMDKIYAALISNDYKQVEKLIDVESFAKMYLVNEYARTVDFDYSSVKFYFKDGKLYGGPVWDFDLSSNNVSVEYYERYWLGESVEERLAYLNSYDDLWCQVHIFELLFKYDEFNDLVKDIFNNYADEFKYLYIDGGLIDITEEKYGSLFKANFGTYKVDGAGWSDTDTYTKYQFQDVKNHDDNLIDLKDWLSKRYDYLNNYFNS